MANDIIDINVTQTVETVEITVTPNLTTVNINKVTGGGGGGNQDLQDVTDLGNTTTNSITALSFIKSGATASDILLGNGTTTTSALINTDAVDRITVKYGESITKGQAVYISSATGTNIVVSKASNTTDELSSKTLAIAETTGVLNDIKTVVSGGLLGGLNTSTATIGDSIWLGTSGNLIFGNANKPVAPAHLVYIGVVSRVHATNGEIFIKIQNGFEVRELHDVLLTSLTNNDVLYYDSATQLWKNKQITGATNLTTSQTSTNVTINSDTGTDATIPLGNGTLAGVSSNDYTTTEKNKLSAISGTNTGDETNATIKTKLGVASASTDGYLTTANWNTFNNKQATLVSGTNIKTINGSSVLGSGDLTISGTGITSLNGLTSATQTFATGTTGTDLNVSSTTSTHTINIPDAGSGTRGLITAGTQTIYGDKTFKGGTIVNPSTANWALNVQNTGSGGGAGITINVPGIAISATSTGATCINANASGSSTAIYGNSPTGNALQGSSTGAGLGISASSNTGTGGRFLTTSGTYIAEFYGNGVRNASISNDGTIVGKSITTTPATEQTYTPAPVWTGTTSPSGTTNHTYIWSRVGNVVTLRINLDYATAGSALNAVTLDLPSDCPTPELPAGVSTAGDVINYGVGNLTTSRAVPGTPTATSCALRLKSTSPNTFEINVWRASAAHKYAHVMIQYFV